MQNTTYRLSGRSSGSTQSGKQPLTLVSNFAATSISWSPERFKKTADALTNAFLKYENFSKVDGISLNDLMSLGSSTWNDSVEPRLRALERHRANPLPYLGRSADGSALKTSVSSSIQQILMDLARRSQYTSMDSVSTDIDDEEDEDQDEEEADEDRYQDLRFAKPVKPRRVF